MTSMFSWQNSVLVSIAQQSESIMHLHISPLFKNFLHLGHDRALCRVLCAVQWVLINYLFYI